MTNEKAQALTTEGFEILCMWSRNIALLPLEDWLEALNRAETLGPIMDPTLYREYLYSDKAKILKELLEKACELKAVVMKHQPTIAKEIQKGFP